MFIELFVGSGAILFWKLNNFPTNKKAVLKDINIKLIDTNITIRDQPRS
ncbi:DNA adenine methylase [Marivirga sp.]